MGIKANMKTIGRVIFIRKSTINDVPKAHFSGLIVEIDFGVISPTTTITIVVIIDAATIAVIEFSPIKLIARLVPTVATVIFNKFPTNKILAKKSSKFSCILRIIFALLLPLWARWAIRILLTAIMLASAALTNALKISRIKIIIIELYKLNRQISGDYKTKSD